MTAEAPAAARCGTARRRFELTASGRRDGAAWSAATVAGVIVLAACTGPVCGPVYGPLAASGVAFVCGATIATVLWRGWAHDRVDRALRDPLTGLPTRAVIEQRLDTATRDGQPVTVALADVDGLHAINANFGHAAGDQYLAAVAHRLARAVPPGGCLVRQGGDEFTLLAPGTDADALATAIGAAMAGPAVIAGHRVQPRASIGIATSDRGDARHARARADVAMYAAKEDGGNRIHIWDHTRHGEPNTDGTRPLLRRRDIDPLAATAIGWQPDPDGDLVPLLLSPQDARLVYRALTWARDVRTDPASGDQRSDYARLAARLSPLLDPAADGGVVGVEPTDRQRTGGDDGRRPAR